MVPSATAAQINCEIAIRNEGKELCYITEFEQEKDK